MAPRVPLSPVDGHALVSRRDLLKLGALLAGGAAAATLAAGCAPRRDTEPSPALGSTTVGTGAPSALAGPVTMIAGGGDPMAEPALRKVFDDFATQHPGLSWDVRALPGGGPEWDRLARALLASGEPVDVTMINGQQLRSWARDGLLADLSADPHLADVLPRVPPRFQIGG